MDSRKTVFNKKKWILGMGSGIFLLFLVGTALAQSMTPHPASLSKKTTGLKPVFANTGLAHLYQTYVDAFESIQKKIEQLQRSEEENHRLRLENAQLKQKLSLKQFESVNQQAASTTKTYEVRLSKETGTRVGRTLASMSYRPPERLAPQQLYHLGLEYLKRKDDEKVAILFTTLTGMENSGRYRTSRNYLITAVAWYRLENLRLAEFYLDHALKQSENEKSRPFQAQAKLWKALVARKARNEKKTQHWLKVLVEAHPHSTEAHWINSRKGNRATASE